MSLPPELLTFIFQYLTNSPDPNYRVLYQIDYFGLCRELSIKSILEPLLHHNVKNYEKVVELLSPNEFKFTYPPKWRDQRPKKNTVKEYRTQLITDLESMADYYTIKKID